MQINQYANEAFQINDEDYYDVDYWTGSAFQSRKISGATLKAELTGSVVNIYNTDGTLLGVRVVTLNGNSLSFTDTSGKVELTGNTLLVEGNGLNEPKISINGDANTDKVIEILSGGDLRWKIETFNDEFGGNSGTDLRIIRYNDAGTVLGTAFEVARDNGKITFDQQYSFPTIDGAPGQVLTTDGAGVLSFVDPGAQPGSEALISASTQYSKTLAATVPLSPGAIANGCTFFTGADLVANGSTPYYEIDLQYGRTITLSGTSGSANINVNGVDYLATFTTNLFNTAQQWVVANQATLNALGIRVFALGSGADGRIRFGAGTNTILNAITITNVTTNLSGTLANEFTGSPSAQLDHFIVPYIGTEIENQRLLHTIRSNFNISTGSVQYAELGLFRFQNDTLIGSTIQITRNPHTTGQQVVIESYTGGAGDAFVTGGFYVALRNTSPSTLDFLGSSGILIQTILQRPTIF
jgi:hypothetical protein